MLGSACGGLAAGVTLLDPSCGDDDGAAEDMVRVGKRTKLVEDREAVSTSRS